MFKPVPGYEGLYEVSDEGVVRSLDRTIDHPLTGRTKIAGRTLQIFWDRYGYPTVNLSRCGKYKPFKVHALVAAAFIGPRPVGAEVCHADDVKTNNHVSNLRYDTRANNLSDSYLNGNRKRKLSCDDAVEIERLYQEGWTKTNLARLYGVSRKSIYLILNTRNVQIGA